MAKWCPFTIIWKITEFVFECHMPSIIRSEPSIFFQNLRMDFTFYQSEQLYTSGHSKHPNKLMLFFLHEKTVKQTNKSQTNGTSALALEIGDCWRMQWQDAEIYGEQGGVVVEHYSISPGKWPNPCRFWWPVSSTLTRIHSSTQHQWAFCRLQKSKVPASISVDNCLLFWRPWF